MATRKALDKGLEKLEKQRLGLLERLGKFAPEQLALKPASGGWSVGQVITHMALVEEGSLAYLRKKYGGGRHSPVGVSSVARLLLLNGALASPIKFKAPATVNKVPFLIYAEAVAKWELIRGDMIGTYARIKDEHIGHDLFKHPSLGRFDLVQALSFIHAHHKRHLGQIDRILRSSI